MKFTSFFLQRVQSVLSKDSARREENKINLFVFFNNELAWQMAFYAAKNVRTRIFLYL